MVNIVVAKYNENVEWTKKLNHKVTIYDKSDKPIEGSIKLKNVGREGETFLYHIVNNYNNLDDVTVFLQGNPFEHLQLLVGWRAKLTDDEINTVVDKMNAEINKATQVPDVAQRMAAIGIVPNNMSVEESSRFYLAEVERWKDVVMKAKFEPVN
jgi:hypothetical protein